MVNVEKVETENLKLLYEGPFKQLQNSENNLLLSTKEEYVNKSCCFIAYFLCFYYPGDSVHCQHATSLELPGTAAFCHISSLTAKNLYTLVKLTCI